MTPRIEMTSARQDAADIGTNIPPNLCKLIENSFPHRASGEALVASVYGEWGIGKTWCLREVEKYFAKRGETPRPIPTSPASAASTAKQAIYIPVFFSPWRYEQEKHLIIPLLKTQSRGTPKPIAYVGEYRGRIDPLVGD